MSTKTFTGVTPANMAFLRSQLQANNITVPLGNSGQINDTVHNIIFSFTYDGASNLTVTLIHKPWWMPESTIWNALQGYLA